MGLIDMLKEKAAADEPTEANEATDFDALTLQSVDMETALGRKLSGDRLTVFWAIAEAGVNGLSLGEEPVANEEYAALDAMGLACWSGRYTENAFEIYVLTEEGRRVRRRIRWLCEQHGLNLPDTSYLMEALTSAAA